MKRNEITWKSNSEVRRYARTRYRGIDQRLLSLRELAIVKKLLSGIRKEDLTILDVPCGYGRFVPLLSKLCLALVCGDLNIHALSYAKATHKWIRCWVNCDVLNLPFKETSFDVVFDFRLLQHFDSLESVIAVLKEFQRVSKKFILFSIYTESWLHGLVRKFRKRTHRIKMFNKATLRSRLKKAGFKIKAEVGVLPGVHAHTIYLVEKRNE